MVYILLRLGTTVACRGRLLQQSIAIMVFFSGLNTMTGGNRSQKIHTITLFQK